MTKNFIRFIAGAVCPNCKELDKIAITPDDQTIYCLNCDFKEHKLQDGPINDSKATEPNSVNLKINKPAEKSKITPMTLYKRPKSL